MTKAYKCKVCQRSFDTKASIVKHFSEEHADIKFHCKILNLKPWKMLENAKNIVLKIKLYSLFAAKIWISITENFEKLKKRIKWTKLRLKNVNLFLCKIFDKKKTRVINLKKS